LWLRASYNPVLDEKGNPVKFFKIASDITESKLRSWDLEAKMTAVERGQASIEFDLDGNVLWCNENFEAAMGYSLSDIKGKHHRTFVDPKLASDPSYNAFWETLRRGQSVDGEFERVNSAGETVWLRASYNPVLDEDGVPVKFFKLATDITESKLRSWDLEAKMAAVDRGQASIEFDLDGNVMTCNDNFTAAMGYTLDEIKGRHHRNFVPPAIAGDHSYSAFWETLNRGQFVEGEFERVNKAGETVWLRASYNPVLDGDGHPVKFFKVASDITEEKHFRDQIEKIVARASQVMGAVAEGDLTQTVDGEYDDHSLQQLQKATNTSIENLAGLVHQIRNSAASMSSSAKEVATANQDLSRRTEGQASSLEETAASMEEMTATVQQNADNARQASQLAVGAREQAQGGGEVVDRAVGAMGAISESSKKIADIIGVIDEIAFQTNLLALNAAVEAARAGDQGRGFAVVASEVRNLAQRSAGAAKEIKALIQDSLDKVDDGSKLVNQSGEQLSEIVSSVKKVSDIIAEIAAASEEQSAGINQVNQAVTVMDQGTQQNAAMVEEAAAASESMQQQSNALLGLTGQFEVSGFGGPAGFDQAPAPAFAAAPPVAAPVEAAAPAAPAEAPAGWNEAPAAGEDDAWQEF
jgi:methyl-accepting chemotaxis protein